MFRERRVCSFCRLLVPIFSESMDKRFILWGIGVTKFAEIILNAFQKNSEVMNLLSATYRK